MAKVVGDDIAGKLGGEIISTEELKQYIDDVTKRIKRSWENEVKMARIKKITRRPGKPTAIQDREKVIVFGMDIVTF